MPIDPMKLTPGWFMRCARHAVRTCLSAPAQAIALVALPPLLVYIVDLPDLALVVVPAQLVGAYWFASPRPTFSFNDALSLYIRFTLLLTPALAILQIMIWCGALKTTIAPMSPERLIHEGFGVTTLIIVSTMGFIHLISFLLASTRLLGVLKIGVFAPFIRDRFQLPWSLAAALSRFAIIRNLTALAPAASLSLFLADRYYLLPLAAAFLYAVFEEIFVGPIKETEKQTTQSLAPVNVRP